MSLTDYSTVEINLLKQQPQGQGGATVTVTSIRPTEVAIFPIQSSSPSPSLAGSGMGTPRVLSGSHGALLRTTPVASLPKSVRLLPCACRLALARIEGRSLDQAKSLVIKVQHTKSFIDRSFDYMDDKERLKRGLYLAPPFHDTIDRSHVPSSFVLQVAQLIESAGSWRLFAATMSEVSQEHWQPAAAHWH